MLEQAEQVRTVHECLQAVRWNDAIGLTLAHALPDGLISVPLADMPPGTSSSPGTKPTPAR